MTGLIVAIQATASQYYCLEQLIEEAIEICKDLVAPLSLRVKRLNRKKLSDAFRIIEVSEAESPGSWDSVSFTFMPFKQDEKSTLTITVTPCSKPMLVYRECLASRRQEIHAIELAEQREIATLQPVV